MWSKKNSKLIIGILACLIIMTGAVNAQPRTYRQIKDIAATEMGAVQQSQDEANLFEFTFDIDPEKGTITRTKVRRLDQETASDDSTVYNIMQNNKLLSSAAGLGGAVFVAVRGDGQEILQLGHRFAFTMRTSPFSQIISGVYKRVYDPEQKEHWREKK